MAGFDNEVVYASNVDFTGNTTVTGQFTTDGQLLIGSTIAPNIRVSTLTGGSGISIVPGPGTITLSVSGSSVGQTITGDSGGALSPTSGNFNIFGSGSITTAGSGSTLTTQLTGLTNHAVLVGAGTSTITKVGPSASTGQVLQNNAAADPSYSTATYPSTAGTSGNVLTSNGTNWLSSAPAVSVSAAWTLIDSHSVTSGTTYNVTSGLTAYNQIMVIFDTLVFSSSSLTIGFSNNGGSTYALTGYLVNAISATSTTLVTSTPLTLSLSTTTTLTGSLIFDNNNNTMGRQIQGSTKYNATIGRSFIGYLDSSTQINAIQYGSGGFTSGTITTWGR
jgi:hypothetical protein